MRTAALDQRWLLPVAAFVVLAGLVHPALAALVALAALGAAMAGRGRVGSLRLTPAWALLPAVLVCVFNFDSLIDRIGIPFANPFNLAWLGAAGLLAVLGWQRRGWPLTRTPLDVPLLVNVLFTMLSVVTAWQHMNHAQWWDKFITFEQWLQWLVFFWIAAGLVRDRRDAHLVTDAVAGMVLVAALFGIRDYLATRAVSGGAIERSQGLFNQANYAASFFAYYLPLLAAMAVRLRGRRRLYYSGVLAVAGIALTVTFGRGGLMGAAIGFLVIVAMTRSKTLLVGALVGAALIGAQPEVRMRFSETVSGNGSGEQQLDDSSGARLIAWRKAVSLIRQEPLTGYGFFAFRYIEHPLDREAAARFGHGRMDVHNGHLNTAVSGGLPGLAALYFQFGAIMLWCARIHRRATDPLVLALAEGLLAAVVVIIVVNLTGTRLYDRQLVGYFWILLGVLQALVRAGETARAPAVPA
jgi:O-antigen ligase